MADRDSKDFDGEMPVSPTALCDEPWAIQADIAGLAALLDNIEDEATGLPIPTKAKISHALRLAQRAEERLTWLGRGVSERIHKEERAPRPLSASSLSPAMRHAVVELVKDHDDDLEAIARCLEERLRQLCGSGGEIPDDAPYTEWRLARNLLAELETTDHIKSVAGYLGVDHEGAAHGSH